METDSYTSPKVEALDNRFLVGFSPEGQEKLVNALQYRYLAPGEFLFYEGELPDGVCLILAGEVEIVKRVEGREQIMGVFKAGDYMGEVAVLDGHGRSTDARAKGPVSIALIPGPTFLDVLVSEPVALTVSLFQNVLIQLRKTNDRFVQEVVRKEKLSLVGEMASSLMHDLRNPIAGVHLAADLITMNHSDPETVHCCDNIRLQCDRVVAMAGELLEFSRGESRLELARTETTAFIERFTKLNDEYLRRTGIAFSINAVPAPIEIDSMRLMRLLQNLVSNAVDALGTKPGGRMEINAWVEEGIFYLTLADNGPGIPESIRDSLFEPFVTHGKKNGTGLGMAIARNVVTAHGGTISFESEIGKGTTFYVQMPQFGAGKKA